MNMSVEQVRANVAVAVPDVECLDVNNAKAFRKAITPVLQEGKKVVIDLSHVEFMDSSGLGAILSCLRRAGQTGTTLKLSGMSEEIRALFVLVRLNLILDIENTREEALESFSSLEH